MFNPHLTAHKNMNNPVYVTVSDRDRVRLKVNEDEPLSFMLRLRIIDRQKVVIASEYLTTVAEGDFFKVILTKSLLDSLEEGETYQYIFSSVDKLTQEETPLYMDYDFKVVGNLEVVGNYLDTQTELYTGTEKYISRKNYEDFESPSKFYFRDLIMKSDQLVNVRLMSHDPTIHAGMTIEKNLQNHYPVTERPEQWQEVATITRPTDAPIPIDLIPEKVYMRVVIHTTHPENFYLMVERTVQ